MSQPARSFLEKVATGRSDLVYLIRGIDQGKPAWYYLLMDKLKLPLFLRRIETDHGNIPLLEYGQILVSGWGQNPPQDVVEKIRQDFS